MTTKAPVDDDIEARIAALPIWRGRVDVTPLAGGMTNRNFLASDGSRRCVVRFGADIPVHGIVRANELAASRAAHAAGLAPAVVYAAPGLLAIEFIDGVPLTAEAVRAPANLVRLVDLLRRGHREVARHLRGATAMFWVFHVLRDYAHTLREDGRHAGDLVRFAACAAALAAAVGPIDVVFAHNDLLAANIIDDGARLWLIDWEYAGFNSPLFDLGGLASNSEMAAGDVRRLVESYFDRPIDGVLERQLAAMTAASLLRETMWSLVSEAHATVAFDFAAYTAENRARFEAAYARFLEL